MAQLTIGRNVNTILPDAFAECSELKDVFILAEKVPKASPSIFEDSYVNYATLHVPAPSIEKYKASETWKGFKAIVEL